MNLYPTQVLDFSSGIITKSWKFFNYVSTIQLRRGLYWEHRASKDNVTITHNLGVIK